MHALAWPHSGCEQGICQRPHFICSCAGSIHKLARCDGELLSGQFIAHVRGRKLAVVIAAEGCKPAIVESCSAYPCECFDERQIITRVIELAIRITHRAAQTSRLQPWHALKCFFPRQETARKQVARPGHS